MPSSKTVWRMLLAGSKGQDCMGEDHKILGGASSCLICCVVKRLRFC